MTIQRLKKLVREAIEEELGETGSIDPSDIDAWLEQYAPGMSWKHVETSGAHKNNHFWNTPTQPPRITTQHAVDGTVYAYRDGLFRVSVTVYDAAGGDWSGAIAKTFEEEGDSVNARELIARVMTQVRGYVMDRVMAQQLEARRNVRDASAFFGLGKKS